jgi:hypothetical protein
VRIISRSAFSVTRLVAVVVPTSVTFLGEVVCELAVSMWWLLFNHFDHYVISVRFRNSRFAEEHVPSDIADNYICIYIL